MSRKEVLADNRCPVCGGKMRLVNVTWVNTFQAPEADQYDRSVSRRRGARKKAPAQTQEMMCSNCCRRSPLKDENGKKTKMGKQVAKETKKGSKKTNKKVVKTIIGWLIFLAILAVCAYFAYKYRGTIQAYIDRAVELFNKAKAFIGKFI